jgi:3-phenylpropionate/trans-cinnamate dioxygenase beta subunit
MEDELAILDETKETLAGRVARLDTGMAWAEDPPSRTRHLIAISRSSRPTRIPS